jgi:trans-aconitate 2-methyltransferase
MDWSAAQYTKFESERTRPVRDLVAAIPTLVARHIVDLGCGPGNSTEVIAARYPDARVAAVDSSPDMCREARRRLPHVQVEEGDIERWDSDIRWDVIVSNAALQWVPDHARLVPRLASRLAPDGSLAIQMPDNLAEPAQVLMREVAASPRWTARLRWADEAPTTIGPAEWYFDLLRGMCARVDVWRTTYHHHLPGGIDDLVEWFKGTGLRPFLQPLDAREQAAYLAEYTAALAAAYPTRADGSVLLPFPRLFIVATRAAD